ncbi:MAG: hypothetical protein KIT50_11760 [Bacteroidetes bacterium]|nr:hypothetical protein [Bacteroidota bacterium]
MLDNLIQIVYIFDGKRNVFSGSCLRYGRRLKYHLFELISYYTSNQFSSTVLPE